MQENSLWYSLLFSNLVYCNHWLFVYDPKVGTLCAFEQNNHISSGQARAAISQLEYAFSHAA